MAQNLMKQIRVEKITLNVGAGKDDKLLKKGEILLGKLSDVKPLLTKTSKRIPGWGLRPGLAIGAKATIRDGTVELLKRLLVAKDNKLKIKNFDLNGNFSFGIAEYIDIEGLEYDPDLKILGLEVAVTLERAGFSVKKRRINPKPLGKSHKISKQEAIDFAKSALGVEVEE